MKNLIKCEWYRLLHNKGIKKWFLLGPCVVLGIIIVFYTLENENNISSLKGDILLMEMFEIGYEFTMIYIGLMVTVLTAKSVNNKTIYYEVMHGYKWNQIIISKMLVNGISTVISIFGVNLLCIGVVSFINGWDGIMTVMDIYPVIFNYLVICLNLSFFFVLIFFALKNIICSVTVGVIIQYVLWFLFKRNKWRGCTGVEFELLGKTTNINYILVSIASLLVVFLLMYIIAEFLCKKRGI